MLTPLIQAAQFLIQTLFELYIFFVLLRVIFHWTKISHTNQLLITIARITHPPLKPIYSILPTVNGIDLAAIILLLGLSMLKIGLLFWLQAGIIPSVMGLATLAFAEILKQLIDIYFYVLLIFTVMSWFNPLTLGPIIEIMIKMSEPLLKPARAILPNMGGLDFSPILVMMGLQLLTILIVAPLTQIGISLIKTTLR